MFITTCTGALGKITVPSCDSRLSEGCKISSQSMPCKMALLLEICTLLICLASVTNQEADLVTELENTTSRATITNVQSAITDRISSVVAKSRNRASSVVAKSRNRASSVVAKSRNRASSVVTKSVTTFQTPSTKTTSLVASKKIQTAPFLCYDCNSGNHLKGGVKNLLCSEAGTISAVRYSPTSCKKPCFSRVDRFPAGSVYRGCSEGLYLPGGIPDSDSCFEDPATRNYLCFCSEDRCNTHNLSQISMAYVEQHYAQTAQKTV